MLAEYPEYIELIERFLTGSISAEEFETDYLKLFKNDTRPHPEEVYLIIEELFEAVDCFLHDDLLPITNPVYEINEAQLRASAREALDALLSLQFAN